MSSLNVALFGGGKDTKNVMEVLSENNDISISSLYLPTKDSNEAKIAKKLNIELYNNHEAINTDEVDIIINDSDSDEIYSYLKDNRKDGVELLNGPTMKLISNMIAQYRDSKNEIKKTLEGQEALFKVGVMISTMDKSRKALTSIVKYAMEITNMQAGSIALYNEENSELEIGASVGFKKGDMPVGYMWPLRKGGITNMILSNNGPLFISDITEDSQFDHSHLLKINVVSILAIPLLAEGRIMGILYVDDFKPKKLNSRELRLAGLLGMQAAIALDKLNIIEQTQQEALLDELTKLHNHRFYVRKLSDEFNRARRYHNDLALCMIDVDNFKHYNDTNGHPKGNKVLAKIATILATQARNFDMVCRYGGEEFAIILPDTNKEAAYKFAMRICKKVAEHDFEFGATQPLGRVTISAGVSGFPDDASSIEELEEMADKALYSAKDGGRNRVCSSRGCCVCV